MWLMQLCWKLVLLDNADSSYLSIIMVLILLFRFVWRTIKLTYIGVRVKDLMPIPTTMFIKCKNRFHYVNCAKCGKLIRRKMRKCCFDLESLKRNLRQFGHHLDFFGWIWKYDSFHIFRQKYNLEPRTDLNDTKLLEALNPNQLHNWHQIHYNLTENVHRFQAFSSGNW